MQDRFRETRDDIYSFTDRILVRCPNCNSCAIVSSLDLDRPFVPYRFVCSTCAATKDCTGTQLTVLLSGEPVDYYFHYPLWLQTSCCSHTLWAYNLRHLDLIEAFVSAKLRERRRDENYGWSNQSLFSRMPKWMKSHNNRSAILKAIEEMRQQVQT
jgi:transcription elongation factor Elf1